MNWARAALSVRLAAIGGESIGRVGYAAHGRQGAVARL